LIPEGSSSCPICRTDLSAVSSMTKFKVVEETLDELASDLSELETVEVRQRPVEFACPTCGKAVALTDSKCPNCGQPLVVNGGMQCPLCGASVTPEMKSCPKCGIALGDISHSTISMVADLHSPEPEEKEPVKVATSLVSHRCPVCEAVSPSSMTKCPICGSPFVEQKPQEVAPKPLRVRKLKTAGATGAQIGDRAASRGLTNGLGAPAPRGIVNGTGRINGLGRTNGLGAVNGTGISNGLGAKTQAAASKRRHLTRWQFLAVLIAIVIIIPTFVYLSYSKSSGQFAVDGNFSDWEKATTFGTWIQSASSPVNITKWAVESQSKDLYFYFATQSAMMVSPDPESFYLFVDSDGTNQTGYSVGQMGAEYMLQLTGWNGSVTSAALSEYSSATDFYDWNSWSQIGSITYALSGTGMEGRAVLPAALGDHARFMMVSKDSSGDSSVTYFAPLEGGLLIVKKVQIADIASAGIVQRSSAVQLLKLELSCEGQGGHVTQLTPVVDGAVLVNATGSFDLAPGSTHTEYVTVDTSASVDGQLVSAQLYLSGVVSSFAGVEILGESARAYVSVPPAGIVIDGAFADWGGNLSTDTDPAVVPDPNVDIHQVGNVSTSTDSFFYVSVQGEMCSGTFVPAVLAKPSGTGGGGVIIHTRRTAEDILRIYIDSDRSSSTGEPMSLDSKVIGADQMVEIRGLYGRIINSTEYSYSSGSWVVVDSNIRAAKDDHRMEIGVPSSSIGGSSSIDFIVETSTWKGPEDLATFDPSTVSAMSRRWVVDPTSTSPFATSLSYQRKEFYDGVNFWSFYFDGSDTVYKYSSDDGMTWTSCGPVFSTGGVNETSVWFDSSTNMVYAIGDTVAPSTGAYVQKGIVDPGLHGISWASSDSVVTVSSTALGGKNTYISEDPNGYLWIASSNCTQPSPARYQLTVFRSINPNDTSSWAFSTQLLAAAVNVDTVKASVVPAGSGSDVWAIFGYNGNVAAKKFASGVWQANQMVYTQAGSQLSTETAPPSVVVDEKGVVHVVYGTGRKNGQTSIPVIEYSHNDTDALTFTAGLNLDPYIPNGVGDYYPTISLDSATGDVYAFWLQTDTSYVPRMVMGTVLSSGVWTNLTFDVQTTFPKQYLTSSYSAAGVYKICWQWTQNTTVPIDVLLDHQQIPEFGDLVLPLLGMIAIFAVYTWPSRTATCARDTPRRTSVTTARRAKTNRKLPPRMRGG
jgi:hypothetical protein